MKKLLLLTVIASVGLLSCKKKGCTDPNAVNYSSEAKKDDGSCQYIPIITIIGQSTVTVTLGSTYTDEGATAANKDGSPVTVTIDDSDVNTSEVGTYEVTFTATNEYGTSVAKRTVNVVIGQENWAGNWVVTSDCGTSFPLNSAPIISVGFGPQDIIIDGMFAISIPPIPLVLPTGLNIASGGQGIASVDGSTITMTNQFYDIAGVGTITYSGTGTMNATGDQFTIDYTYDNTLPLIGGSGACTATYTKQ